MKKLSSEYIAPSWSWACGFGPVAWYWNTLSDSPLVSILEAQTQCSSLDRNGRLSGGFVKVKGLLVRAFHEGIVIRNDTSTTLKVIDSFADDNNAPHLGNDMQKPVYAGRRQRSSLQSINAQLAEDFQGQNLGHSRELLLLPLLGGFRETSKTRPTVNGLILERVSSSQDIFIRIGHFLVYEEENLEKLPICVDQKEGSIRLKEGVSQTVVTIL
jgi:hypothetical protein